MDLLAPAFTPFTTALTVAAAIALLEIGGLLFGVAFSGLVDSIMPEIDLDGADLDGAALDNANIDSSGLDATEASGSVLTSLLSWLCVGKAPALILLAAFLLGFGVSGASIQQIAQSVFSAPLPSAIASLPAFLLALPITRFLGQGVARFMPREQTDAVKRESFIGATAQIIRGEAKAGIAAEAKLTDVHGTTHYFLVEPDDKNQSCAAGTDVLIVARDGIYFKVIANNSPGLSS